MNADTETNSTASPIMARDRIAQTYLGQAGNEETQQIARARIDWLAEQVRGTAVLDLGCSEGILSLLLARRGLEVTGVDRNAEALAFGRELLRAEPEDIRERVEFVEGDGHDVQLSGRSFDTVVLGEVLEHLEEPGRMLQAARDHLCDGGRLLITTPLGYFPDPDHRQTFTLTSFANLLRPGFDPEVLDVVDGYIRFVGTRADDPKSWDRLGSPAHLIELLEKSLLEIQKRYFDRLLLRTEQWRESRGEMHRWKKQSAHQQERREQALSDARRWLEAYRQVRAERRRFEAAANKTERELREASAEAQRIRAELAEVYAGKRYRIGDAMVNAARSPMELLRLPLRLLRIFREPRSRPPEHSTLAPADPDKRGEILERHRVFLKQFNDWAGRIASGGHRHIVVMYGGTTYMQDLRANRPIRLTRALDGLGTPVLFNFHRWHETDHIPDYDGGLVFQSPIDKTPSLVHRLFDDDLGGARPVLIVSYPHPSVCRLINLANANGWATIYDCRDDWEEFHKVEMAQWYRPGVEAFVVNNCDLTCCVAGPLREKMSGLTTTRPVRLSPNAYDPGFLAPGYERRPDPKVKIGYFGHLSDRWFDWESLFWMARRRPDYKFEIIGHFEPKELQLPPNVSLLGPKTHTEICGIAATWRVGIIPFKVGRLADGVDPIKIYEYFGLGLPVVSFRMPQIRAYPHTTTVETKEAFVEALDAAAQVACDPEEFEAFLLKNTWEQRARQLLDWADEILDRPACEKTFHPAEPVSGG